MRRADEGGDKDIIWSSIKFVAAANLLDDTLIHDKDAVSQGHCFHLVMCHIDSRGFEFGMEFAQFNAHPGTQLGIQVGQGLIEHEDLRLADNGAPERNSLALTAA